MLDLQVILDEQQYFLTTHRSRLTIVQILHSNDPNDLIYALHDFTVDILMFTNDVPDEVRFAEQIIDNIVADHDHG